ncbi:hypothetical protein [Ideonella sp.]|uniref:hypothetical protein n=1 Tax=Ideonella sp. TaxID=1929293 RepID=UPI0035AEDF82
MRTMLCGAVIAMALFAGGDAAATTTYSLTILENHGNIEGQRSSALGISRKGVAVGQSIASDEDQIVAVRWSASGVAEALPRIGTGNNAAIAANDRGQVLGVVDPTPGANGVPVLWESDGSWAYLTPLVEGGLSTASGINKKGQIVGSSQREPRGPYLAVNWRKGAPPNPYPNVPGAYGSAATAVALNGWVGGYTMFSLSEQRATVWKDRVPTDLGTLGGTSSAVTAINDVGYAVGWSRGFGNNNTRPFILKGGNSLVELPTLDGTDAWAYGINNKGVAVGYGMSAGTTRAVMWKDGGAIDLNDKLSVADKSAGWVLRYAIGIDDRGRVLGVAFNSTTQHSQPFQLSP